MTRTIGVWGTSYPEHNHLTDDIHGNWDKCDWFVTVRVIDYGCSLDGSHVVHERYETPTGGGIWNTGVLVEDFLASTTHRK